MSVVIVDRSKPYSIALKTRLNDALREGSRDILVLSNNRAPFDKGHLRSDKDAKQQSPLHWRVSYWKEYARFQEFGGDGKRVVRNYKTNGTGKHYLRSSGDDVAKTMRYIIKKHCGRAF
jgi:hypothetical protein